MRMPRPRFTVRRMMVAIAVLATVLGLGIEHRRNLRRSRFLQDAEEARNLELGCRLNALAFQRRASRERSHPVNKRLAELNRQKADYYRRIWERNNRAASRSWASFSSDDPPLLSPPANISRTEFPDVKVGDPWPE
jgi:hypothetical protein